MNILVSACLLGVNCKYDQGNNFQERVAKLKEKYHLIPICPEIMGGLSTPRIPAEVCGKRVVMKDGTDVTCQFENGAKEAWKLAEMFDCRYAILKEKSPSCGNGQIYDGTFTKTLTHEDGVTAKFLKEHGICVLGEKDPSLESLLEKGNENETKDC